MNPYISEQNTGEFTFYRVPKALIDNARYRGVSSDAKLLYALLLDRLSLSLRNGWQDEQGRVYIYYPADEIMSTLNCQSEKASKLLAELDSKKGIGLIDRVRQGQGKPTIIYVKNFACNSFFE